MPAKAKIGAMFDSIAGDYDRLNHVLSLDVDKTWRRKALRLIRPSECHSGCHSERSEESPDHASFHILDLACGTGDFAIAIAKALGGDGHVTGVDLSEGMLAVMREKVDKLGLADKISIEQGDGEDLRFPDDTFDRVTNAFGIRNFEDRPKGLREALRVLKPGGRLVILELSRPENKVLRWFYDLYFLNILPKIGGKVSGQKAAYSYLPASVATFPGKQEFMQTMRDAGFTAVAHKAFTFGICRMYSGEKPCQ